MSDTYVPTKPYEISIKEMECRPLMPDTPEDALWWETTGQHSSFFYVNINESPGTDGHNVSCVKSPTFRRDGDPGEKSCAFRTLMLAMSSVLNHRISQ